MTTTAWKFFLACLTQSRQDVFRIIKIVGLGTLNFRLFQEGEGTQQLFLTGTEQVFPTGTQQEQQKQNSSSCIPAEDICLAILHPP